MKQIYTILFIFSLFFAACLFSPKVRAQETCTDSNDFEITASISPDVDAGSNVLFQVDTKGRSYENEQVIGYLRIYSNEGGIGDQLYGEPIAVYYYNDLAVCGGYQACVGVSAPQINGPYYAVITQQQDVNSVIFCSNDFSFEIVNGTEPPSTDSCVSLGQSCCIDNEGYCPSRQAACCNICPTEDENVVLFCNPNNESPTAPGYGTVEQYTAGVDCGIVGIRCCFNPSREDQYFCTGGEAGSQTSSCVCESIAPPSETSNNLFCDSDNAPDEYSINTAIGCIPFKQNNGLISFLLTWASSVVGGIGVLLIVYSGIQFTFSQGNPYKVRAAQELLVAAVSGIIYVVLSVYLLRIIGVNLFGIS